jgi:hypothetical protein
MVMSNSDEALVLPQRNAVSAFSRKSVRPENAKTIPFGHYWSVPGSEKPVD